MNLKSKDMLLAILTGVVVFFMFALKNSKVLYKIRPETANEALLEEYDSSHETRSDEVEAFSSMHRVRIDLPQHVKYYSKTDTLVAVFDTLGVQVGKTQSYRQFGRSEQRQIREILNNTKK